MYHPPIRTQVSTAISVNTCRVPARPAATAIDADAVLPVHLCGTSATTSLNPRVVVNGQLPPIRMEDIGGVNIQEDEENYSKRISKQYCMLNLHRIRIFLTLVRLCSSSSDCSAWALSVEPPFIK